jgi:hypothetical protein
MMLQTLYQRRAWLFYAPIAALALLVLWWTAAQYLRSTPRELTLLIDRSQTAHQVYASVYQDKLADSGIRLSIEHSAQPLRSLQERKADASTAFAALSTVDLDASAENHKGTQALAAVAREPFWIFADRRRASRLQEMGGLRIGIVEGDRNTQLVAKALLNAVKVNSEQVRWISLAGPDLAQYMFAEKVDAVMFSAHPNSERIRTLARVPFSQMISAEQVGPMMQRFASLRPSILPHGSIELRGDIPAQDVTLLASRLHLVVAAGMPPALQRVLLEAAQHVHERPSFLHRNSEFPNSFDLDLPASPVARAFAHGGKPWLERILPYGLAQFVQWLLVAALPLVLLVVVLMLWIPMWFDWRVNSVLQSFYGELKFLETEFDAVATERPIEFKRLIERVDDMELQAMQLNLPQAYAERWYTLRQDLVRARERLLSLRAR